MGDIDFTGSRALGEVLDQFDADGIAFAVARAGEGGAQRAAAGAGSSRASGADHFFDSVDAAVSSLDADRRACLSPQPGGTRSATATASAAPASPSRATQRCRASTSSWRRIGC